MSFRLFIRSLDPTASDLDACEPRAAGQLAVQRRQSCKPVVAERLYRRREILRSVPARIEVLWRPRDAPNWMPRGHRTQTTACSAWV